jgi:hypothetical protein
VLNHAGAVWDRAVRDPRQQAQAVDLDGMTPLVADIEQADLDTRGGDRRSGPVREQRRQRYPEGTRERVQRAQGGVAGAVLDFRQRSLADSGGLREGADGQAALPARGPQSLAHQAGQVVHEHQA